MRLVPILVTLAAALPGQSDGPDLAALRAKKLAAPWVTKAGFTTELDEALARARAGDRPVFACFTRSFPLCPECEAVENGPLSADEFGTFAQDAVPFLHCTSGTPDEPLRDLPREKGVFGFPALLFLDGDGTVLARLDQAQLSVAAFRNVLAEVNAYRAMRAALADDGGAPDAHQRAVLLVAEARLRRWSFPELDARIRAFGADLPPECGRELAPLRSTLEFDWLVALADITPKEKALRLALFVREKRVPTGDRALRFWLEYGAAGEAVEDPVMVDTAAEVLETRADAPAGHAARLRARADALRRR